MGLFKKKGGQEDRQPVAKFKQKRDKISFGPLKALSAGEGGLLKAQDGKFFSLGFAFAVFMELLGVFLFALLGANCAPDYIPAANGITLAVLVYITANVSGGHLNPCVTIATMVTGHISLMKGVAYVIAQIVGSTFAAMLTVALRGGTGFHLGMGNGAPGCFYPDPLSQSLGESNGTTHWQAFGWELIFTFILVSTVYAVAIGKPNFGIIGPLIVGLSLYACASAGEQYTGASLNIARTLGPVIAYQCHTSDAAWYYVIAELVGGVLAGILAWPLYGTGSQFLRLFDAGGEPDNKKDDKDGDGEDDDDVEAGGKQNDSLREQYNQPRPGLLVGPTGTQIEPQQEVYPGRLANGYRGVGAAGGVGHVAPAQPPVNSAPVLRTTPRF